MHHHHSIAFGFALMAITSCTAPSPYGMPPTAQAQAGYERGLAERQRRASENELGGPTAQVIQQRSVSTPFGSRTRTSNTQVYGSNNVEVYDGYPGLMGAGQTIRVTRGPDPSATYPRQVSPPTSTPQIGSPAVRP